MVGKACGAALDERMRVMYTGMASDTSYMISKKTKIHGKSVLQQMWANTLYYII